MALYVKFGGDRPVNGGATAPGYGGWFEALSYQPIMHGQRRMGSSGGAGTALRVQVPLDAYSLQLMGAGGSFQTVQLHLVVGDRPARLSLEFVLSGVTVASASTSGGGLELILCCESMEVRYYQFDAGTGKATQMQPNGWDIKQSVVQ